MNLNLILGDALAILPALPEGFVDLIVTSPPYFNARDYSHWQSYGAYLDDMRLFLSGAHHVLKDGGRIAVNICAGYNRAPWIPVSGDLTKIIQEAGFLLRGQIIWDKGGQSSGRTAWGAAG